MSDLFKQINTLSALEASQRLNRFTSLVYNQGDCVICGDKSANVGRTLCSNHTDEYRWLHQRVDRLAELERVKNHKCGVSDDDVCFECCEHDFDADEGFMCLNCGMDGYDRFVSAAEAACEGDR